MFFLSSGSCNGIAVWADFDLDGRNISKSTVSTGPTQPFEVGSLISWDMNIRQGVHIIPNPVSVTKNENVLSWKVTLKPSQGDIKFHFKIK